MSDEKFCPEHGPYSASYDSCPICSGRQGSPPSLSDMELRRQTPVAMDMGMTLPIR